MPSPLVRQTEYGMLEPHTHEFKHIETIVPVRRVVTENGKPVRDTISGKDTLKQRKCKCGKLETYDLERKLA